MSKRVNCYEISFRSKDCFAKINLANSSYTNKKIK